MTDRVRTLTVVLDRDYRTDDVEGIVDAIRMTKGVAKVDLGDATSGDDYVSRATFYVDVGADLVKLVHLAAGFSPADDRYRRIRAILREDN